MSEPTNQDLKELLLAFEKKVDLSLSDMNRRMEVGFAELNRKIDVGLAEVRGEIKRVEEKLTGEINRLDTEIKSVEANLSAKLDGLGKRVENQEFVSRGATVALVGGLVTGMVKLLFFPDRLP
jgi:ferritin-like metal-binding protein YciE